MRTTQKQKIVSDFQNESTSSVGLIITSYGGLKTTEINEMRQKIRPFTAEYRVVKNSLTKIALKNAGFTGLADMLSGPSAIVIEQGDALGTIKAVYDFAKTHVSLKINGGIFDGKIFDSKQLKALSALPSREALISQLLGVLEGPATALVSVLQAKTRELVSVLDAVSKKPDQKA